jgi:hypothetical protein
MSAIGKTEVMSAIKQMRFGCSEVHRRHALTAGILWLYP